MIIENPLLPVALGGIFGVSCLALWYVFRHWLPLLLGSVALVLAVGILALSLLIDSPREAVERTLHQLASAAHNNDVEKLLQYVSPSAAEVRDAATQEMNATKFVSCWIAKVHDITIDETKTPPEARANLGVIAVVEESRYGAGRGRVQLSLDLVKEPDGQWRVLRYSYSVQ